MIRSLFMPLLVAIIALSSCNTKTSQSATTDLSPTEFAAKLKEMPDAPLIDVRTPGEFSGGHLANAKNINWDGSNFQSEISGLDKAKPVFVYCLSGARSAAAAREMRSQGFKEVYEMQGGILKWRAANLPETTDATATGEQAASSAMTLDQFNKLVNTDKIVLVDFYADWCQPCKKMEPYLKEIASEMSATVEVVRINADENPELCRELKIDALPYLHVYKKNALSWSNMGLVSKEEIVKHLM
ncbi:MAG: redoxin domain-containing protein [Saprospiraceae bacterium]|nr:redoxin domain-containing protein [Saprospiraceae bacterium]